MPIDRIPVLAGWLVLAAAGAGGCAAGVITADGEALRVGSPGFRRYVEQVFRQQNRIATELGFALVDAELDGDQRAYRRLDAAEQRLLAACAGLNELAAMQRDGRRMGRLRALRAARAAPECEAAALAAEAVIDPV